jgi:hypothetical protein
VLILEAEGSLVRLRHELLRTDDEQAAIEGDVVTFQKLRAKHWNTATPAGPAPQELGGPEVDFRSGRFNFHRQREEGATDSTAKVTRLR